MFINVESSAVSPTCRAHFPFIFSVSCNRFSHFISGSVKNVIFTHVFDEVSKKFPKIIHVPKHVCLSFIIKKKKIVIYLRKITKKRVKNIFSVDKIYLCYKFVID